jgi:hypothetical protein
VRLDVDKDCNCRFMTTPCSAVIEHPAVHSALGLGYASLPFSFSASCALFTTGIGWVFYRPLLAIMLFALASIPYVAALARYLQGRDHERRHRLS